MRVVYEFSHVPVVSDDLAVGGIIFTAAAARVVVKRGALLSHDPPQFRRVPVEFDDLFLAPEMPEVSGVDESPYFQRIKLSRRHLDALPAQDLAVDPDPIDPACCRIGRLNVGAPALAGLQWERQRCIGRAVAEIL